MKIPSVYEKRRNGRNNQATCEADRIVGEVLREMRNDAGMTLGEVGATGVAKTSVVGSYERGERSCSLDITCALAAVYGVGEVMVLSVIARRVSLAQAGCRTEDEREARAREMGWAE